MNEQQRLSWYLPEDYVSPKSRQRHMQFLARRFRRYDGAMLKAIESVPVGWHFAEMRS